MKKTEVLERLERLCNFSYEDMNAHTNSDGTPYDEEYFDYKGDVEALEIAIWLVEELMNEGDEEF